MFFASLLMKVVHSTGTGPPGRTSGAVSPAFQSQIVRLRPGIMFMSDA